MPRKIRLPDGKLAFSMSTVVDIKNLLIQDARLQSRFAGTRAKELMEEIRRLENEDKELECMVENLHKEVKQIAEAASRLQDMADKEDMDARAKKEKLKNCLEQLVKDHSDMLSDPESFAEGYYMRLRDIGEIIDVTASPSGSLIDLKETDCCANSGSGRSPSLTKLNRAHRRKLLVQVELDRVEEELKMEIERNAISEPASHPVFGSEDEDEDADEELEQDTYGEDGDLDLMNSENEGGKWD